MLKDTCSLLTSYTTNFSCWQAVASSTTAVINDSNLYDRGFIFRDIRCLIK
ncbi:MAG: hypothetical protein IPL35_11880 [Sphingobacteriales bacterium]|nr:hypothetical protein [Sphingobacteriales bacterium]